MHKRGFSIVELLVVIGIITILLGLTLPAVQAARESVRKIQCQNKLRQLTLAANIYETALRHLPPGQMGLNDQNAFQTWAAKLLPFLEQSSLSDQIDAAYARSSIPFDITIHNHFDTPVIAFACPSDARVTESQIARGTSVALLSYVGVAGTNSQKKDGTLYFRSKTRFADIQDGLSNTLLIFERPPSKDHYFGWWYAGYADQNYGGLDATLGTNEINFLSPGQVGWNCPKGPYQIQRRSLHSFDAQCGVFHPWSLHVDLVNASRVDGSTIGISYHISPEVLRNLGTRNGNEILDALN